MQNRMMKFTLDSMAVDRLLTESAVGRISTIGADGYPYTVSVHYVYDGRAVYFHGLPKGEKLDNIRANSKVCFEVSGMKSILSPADESNICTADTEYESVVIRGNAYILENFEEKKAVLQKIVEKYLPGAVNPMPEKRIQGTAVVKVVIENKTGKYHK
ncbi:MAG: pyridoxamine 5'-phosphate oxidase family protein [Oscillospiraceae bacterium]|nr:pyridoxamine 5'-phosphate oxidase family protein [Oscillospiraceae bacterium]